MEGAYYYSHTMIDLSWNIDIRISPLINSKYDLHNSCGNKY